MTHIPPAPIHPPLPWMDHARCRDVDPEWFFPIASGVSPESEAARNVCAACPVQPECLAYSLEQPDLYGIWAGLGRRERQELRRNDAATKGAA